MLLVVIFIANVYILHSISIVFKASENIIKIIIQSVRAECEGVHLLRRHHDLPPPGGLHPVTFTVGPVLSLQHLFPVVVEVGVVPVPGVNTGHHAEADPPGPGHGHSEDSYNETNFNK